MLSVLFIKIIYIDLRITNCFDGSGYIIDRRLLFLILFKLHAELR